MFFPHQKSEYKIFENLKVNRFIIFPIKLSQFTDNIQKEAVETNVRLRFEETVLFKIKSRQM